MFKQTFGLLLAALAGGVFGCSSPRDHVQWFEPSGENKTGLVGPLFLDKTEYKSGCGYEVAMAIFKHFEITPTVLVQEMEKKLETGKGLTLVELIGFLRANGVKLSVSNQADLLEIEKHVASGKPAVMLVDLEKGFRWPLKKLSPIGFQSMKHFFLIFGVNDKKVVCADHHPQAMGVDRVAFQEWWQDAGKFCLFIN